MRRAIISFTAVFIFAQILFAASLFAAPVKYDKDSKQTPSEFFEKEYRSIWESLPEYQQFAIACSSNVFERDGMYHLIKRLLPVSRSLINPGKSTIMNSSWKIIRSLPKANRILPTK